jgi:transcriptional regulator with XRE-family HTH domain
MTDEDTILVTLARRACRNGDGRRLRLELGVSLQQAAAALEVDPSSLSRWERGLVLPQADRSVRYGRILALWLQAAETGT